MLLTVARIGRPHGIRGEVTVEVRTDEPDRRLAPGAVLLTSPARPGGLGIRSTRWHGDRLLIRFRGISDRTAAQTLTGLLLQVEVSQGQASSETHEAHTGPVSFLDGSGRAAAATDVPTDSARQGVAPGDIDGHLDRDAGAGNLGDETDDSDAGYYDHELVGLAAELADGTVVGTVTGLLHSSAQDILVIARPSGAQTLVPFVLAIVPVVDLAGGRVVLDPPGGLLDEDPGAGPESGE